jgi:formamidopyrimidine-DNA glycosylase
MYELNTLIKSAILPGFTKILNMYVSELLWQYKIVRFVNQNKINNMEITDFVKKIHEVQ